MLHRLWKDESGWVFSTELILISTVAVLGAIVGLSAYRDNLVQELGDAGAAINALNQSYGIVISGTLFTDCGCIGDVQLVTYGTEFGTSADCSRVTVTASFNNFRYTDTTDLCEVVQTAGGSPACISLGQAPSEEL